MSSFFLKPFPFGLSFPEKLKTKLNLKGKQGFTQYLVWIMWQNKSLEMAYVCETCTSNGVLKATRYSICVLHINSQLEQSNINGGRSVVSSVETIINKNNCFCIKQFLLLVDLCIFIWGHWDINRKFMSRTRPYYT